MIITLIIFLVMLSVLVLIHEAGHFFVAKWLGIKVEEFGFGFPPKLFGIKKGETEYTINLLPLGGFVKLYGEDEAGGGRIANPKSQKTNSKDIERAFFARPVWQKTLVIVAGVFMNFLLAVGINTYLASSQGVEVPGNHVIVVQVAKNSPAEKAGLHIDDTILSLNDTPIKNTSQLISLTKQEAGKPVTLILQDKEKHVREATLTPRKNYPKNEGSMGVAIAPDSKIIKYPFLQALGIGFSQTILVAKLTVVGFGVLFSQVLQGGGIPAGVAGPIGIARLTGQVAREYGLVALLSLAAFMSANLAFLNILPIPALDGGRLLFIVINAVSKALFGKQIDPTVESYIHTAVFILLIVFILFISIHDIQLWLAGTPLIPQ